MTADTLQIDVISDVMCPWCFIGKYRLERALELVGDPEVLIRWRPFQLDSTLPPGGLDRKLYLHRKFGREGTEQVLTHIATVGAQEGIPFAFDKIRKSPNTLDSHRLIHWAEADNCQDQVVERLFSLYFLEGRNLSNQNLLAEVAEEAKMDGHAVRERLASDEAKDLIRKYIERASQIGVTGVPAFLLNGHALLVGAQPADVLAKALLKVLESDKHPTDIFESQ